MRIAFVVFDYLTTMDFIGVFDAVTRLKTMKFIEDLQWDICAPTTTVNDGLGVQLIPTKVGEPLSGYDVLVVAGGYGTRALAKDADFIAWMQTAADCPLKTSVCTGSLLLGAAGFLQGKRATTHRGAFELLKPYAASVVDDRVVDEGDVITARGVTSAIDLGLYLCEKFAGRDACQRIRAQMDYQK